MKFLLTVACILQLCLAGKILGDHSSLTLSISGIYPRVRSEKKCTKNIAIQSIPQFLFNVLSVSTFKNNRPVRTFKSGLSILDNTLKKHFLTVLSEKQLRLLTICNRITVTYYFF